MCIRLISILLIAFLQSEAFALNILKSIEATEEDGQIVPVYSFLEPVNPLTVETQLSASGVELKFTNAQMITDKNSLSVTRGGIQSIHSVAESDGDIQSTINFMGLTNTNTRYEKVRLVAEHNLIKVYLDKATGPVVGATNEMKNEPKSEVAGKASTNGKVTGSTTKAESEIPLFVKDSSQKSKPSKSPYLKLLFSLLIIGIMSGGLLFFSRWYAGRNKKLLEDTKIRVLSQHSLGPRKQLMIVRVAGESVLIGVTDSNITMLKSLSLLDEDIPNQTPIEFTESMSQADQKQTYSQNIKLKTNRVNAEKKANSDVDEFVIGNIKDKISTTLKGMRDI